MTAKEDREELLKQVALIFGAWKQFGYDNDITIGNINHLYQMGKVMNPDLMQRAWRADYHAFRRGLKR